MIKAENLWKSFPMRLDKLGKSTLPSLLLGVAQPTEGSIEVSGKKTPLLELGAGFHPDLTGIENIIINGVLLGHTEAEVRARMGDITAFQNWASLSRCPSEPTPAACR